MNDFLGPLSAFGASCTWAVGVTVYSSLSRSYPAFAINFTRAVIALVLAVASLLALEGFSGATTTMAEVTGDKWLWFFVSMTASYGLGDLLFLTSTRLIGPSHALAIASTFPVWASLAGVLFFGQSLSATQMLGVLLIVSGVTKIILLDKKEDAKKSDHHVLGLVLAGITSLFWAGNSLAVGKAATGMPTLAAVIVRMFAAAVLCPLFGWLSLKTFKNLVTDEGRIPADYVLPKVAIQKYGWIFALEGFGGALVYTYGLAHTSAAVGAGLTSLSPALTLPATWLFLKQKPRFAETLAILAVTVGVWLLVMN